MKNNSEGELSPGGQLLVSKKQAAQFLGYCTRTIDRLENGGFLKANRTLRTPRYLWSDLVKLAQGGN